MPISLIVNADDYGRTPGVSAGIRRAHLHGIVTSTTAMMNMPGAEDALRQAQAECPHLGLGVHLVITSGAPLLPRQQVRSLTAGAERFPGVEEQFGRLAQIDPAEARAEWHAQIERFVAATGKAPDHLDSHHHASYVTPGLFRAMLELATEYGCAIRQPRPLRPEGSTGVPGELAAQMATFLPALQAEFKPRSPDFFCADFYDQTATLAVACAIFEALPEGVIEFMCHPGYADEALLGALGSSYNRRREDEIAVLTDPALKAILARRGISLVHFGAL